MAHSDWMRAGRRVSHKIEVTSYVGPKAKIELYPSNVVSETDSDGSVFYSAVPSYNNMSTEYNVDNLTTNYGSGKNVGFFDGPELSIHLMSETLSYDLKSNPEFSSSGTSEDRGNSRYVSDFYTDADCNIHGRVVETVSSVGNHIYKNIEYFPLNINIQDKEGASTTRYLQISGNKNTNDYPVDIEITNNSSSEKILVSGNSKVDCIIDFGEEIDVSQGLSIKITKWSKPFSCVKFSYIGYYVTFDVSDLLRTYNIEDGCSYDGGDNFSYGVKSNSGNISLYKDKLNKASIISLYEGDAKCDNIISSNSFSSSYSSEEYFDDGVLVDGAKRYYVTNKDGYPNGSYIYISRPINWVSSNNNNGFGVVTFDVYNHYNESLFINPLVAFPFYVGGSDTSGNKIFRYKTAATPSERISLQPHKWTTVSYISNNKNNPYNNAGFMPTGSCSIRLDAVNSKGAAPDRSFKLELKNIAIGVATDEQVEKYSLVENTQYGESIHYDLSLSKIILYGPKHTKRAVSKIDSMIRNDNANIRVSVSTVGDSFKQIANMWVENYDYDHNGIGVTFNINDIFSKMNKLEYDGSVISENDAGYIDGYVEGYVTQRSFWTNVGFGRGLNINSDIVPQFIKEPNIISQMPTILDSVGAKYFEIFNNASKAMNTFIVQDMSDRDVSFIYCNKKNYNIFPIANSQCYSISDKRYEKNNISKIFLSPIVPSSNADSSILYRAPEFTITTPKCYLNAKLEEVDGVNAYLLMDEINISGKLTLPIEKFKMYERFSVGLECITSYRKINNNSLVWSDTVGEVIGDDSYKKQYIKYEDEGGVDGDRNQVYTGSLDLVGDENITTVSTNNKVSIVSITDTSVELEYTLAFNPIYYKSIFGESYSTKKIGIGDIVIFSKDYIQRYLGAYRLVLIGSNAGYDYSDVSYGDKSGNELYVNQNVFIQQDSKVYSSSLDNILPGDTLAESIAKDIYSEYCGGKKIAKIDYIGSPYLKVYDIITLENGISYRLLKIKHVSNGGGFKQQLILMEKE